MWSHRGAPHGSDTGSRSRPQLVSASGDRFIAMDTARNPLFGQNLDPPLKKKKRAEGPLAPLQPRMAPKQPPKKKGGKAAPDPTVPDPSSSIIATEVLDNVLSRALASVATNDSSAQTANHLRSSVFSAVELFFATFDPGEPGVEEHWVSDGEPVPAPRDTWARFAVGRAPEPPPMPPSRRTVLVRRQSSFAGGSPAMRPLLTRGGTRPFGASKVAPVVAASRLAKAAPAAARPQRMAVPSAPLASSSVPSRSASRRTSETNPGREHVYGPGGLPLAVAPVGRPESLPSLVVHATCRLAAEAIVETAPGCARPLEPSASAPSGLHVHMPPPEMVACGAAQPPLLSLTQPERGVRISAAGRVADGGRPPFTAENVPRAAYSSGEMTIVNDRTDQDMQEPAEPAVAPSEEVTPPTAAAVRPVATPIRLAAVPSLGPRQRRASARAH